MADIEISKSTLRLPVDLHLALKRVMLDRGMGTRQEATIRSLVELYVKTNGSILTPTGTEEAKDGASPQIPGWICPYLPTLAEMEKSDEAVKFVTAAIQLGRSITVRG
jgi:hypothetical protein